MIKLLDLYWYSIIQLHLLYIKFTAIIFPISQPDILTQCKQPQKLVSKKATIWRLKESLSKDKLL